MPESSVIFSPDMDERALDQEVGKIDDSLDDLDTTISPEMDGGMSMDGLGPDGISGVSGGGGGLGGAGTTGAAAGLASKLPKPVAGVATSAAMPIAIAGGVGLSMLSAMQSASARMQTSSSLLGIAVDQFFRPIGDQLDKLLIRPVVMDLLDATDQWQQDMMSGNWIEGITGFTGSLLRGETGAVINAIFPPTLGASILSHLSTELGDVNWSGLAGDIAGMLPNITVPNVLNSLDFPNITAKQLLGLLAFNPVTAPLIAGKLAFDAVSGSQLVGKIDFDPISGDTLMTALKFNPVTAPAVLSAAFGDLVINEGDILDHIFGGGDSGDGGDDDPPTRDPRDPPIRDPGPPEGGPGRPPGVIPVGNPTRTLRTTDAARDAGVLADGTVSTDTDTSGIEQKLDEVKRMLDRVLNQNPSIEVDGETLGRVTDEQRQSSVTDTNPLI